MVSTAVSRHSSSWWAAVQPNPTARLRLLCLPYAGGDSGLFYGWPAQLPRVEIWAAQLPGRRTRSAEPARTNLLELSDELAAALEPIIDDGCAFFGHSLGAILAFEIARRLRRRAWPPPSHLFVGGRRAPQLPNLDPIRYQQPDDEFVATLRELEGTPPECLANQELLNLVLPRVRADFQLAETYQYRDEPPLTCPITAIGGVEDVETHDGRLDAWRSQTTGRFSARLVPGNHFFLQTHPAALFSTIKRAIDPAEL